MAETGIAVIADHKQLGRSAAPSAAVLGIRECGLSGRDGSIISVSYRRFKYIVIVTAMNEIMDIFDNLAYFDYLILNLITMTIIHKIKDRNVPMPVQLQPILAALELHKRWSCYV